MAAKPLVLLVDDDAAFRTVMAAELSRSGFDVRTAASGEEALAVCAQTAPQVILLDLQMPGISGLDVLKALRERHAPGEVVVLTGHGSIDTAIDAIRIGAFDYVSKPCPLDELEIRIQRALERQALKDRADLLERGLTPPDLGSAFIGESRRSAAYSSCSIAWRRRARPCSSRAKRAPARRWPPSSFTPGARGGRARS